MTAKELQDYLTENHEERFYIQKYIEAEQEYRARLEAFELPHITKPHIKIIDDNIKKQRDQINRLTAIIVSWSELISNDIYRQIFLDRFLDGMKWTAIADKNNYSEKHVFNIKDKCLKEIASKSVCELPSEHNNLITLSN